MTTQVIFKIDKQLKDQAMKKAQKEGLPFSFVLKMATQAYVDNNLDIELVARPQLNAKTRRELIKISKDIKEGKNLSPAFSSAAEMKKYLMK